MDVTHGDVWCIPGNAPGAGPPSWEASTFVGCGPQHCPRAGPGAHVARRQEIVDQPSASPSGSTSGVPTRKEHQGFGEGIHDCVGAPLTRLETRIAIDGLLSLPKPRLAPAYRPRHVPSVFIRRLERLDVELDLR